MKNSIKTYFILIGVVFFTSCNQYYYMPVKHNVKPFNEKGDVILSVNSGSNDNYGIEAGYAITDNIGVSSVYNSFDFSTEGNSNQVVNDFIWDNELVFYKKLNTNFYSGVNLGVGFGDIGKNNIFYYYKFDRQYILPWLVYKTNSRIYQNTSLYMGFSAKLSRLNYNIHSQTPLESAYDEEVFHYFYDRDNLNENRFNAEIGLTLGIDFKIMKIQLQNQTVYYPSKKDYIIPNNMVLSVYFYINNFFKKSPEKSK